jgi:hypothetical protein
MASYMDAVNGKHTDGREQGVGMKRMKRVEVEKLLLQMAQFADFLFAQGMTGAGNAVLGAVESADAALENVELED